MSNVYFNGQNRSSPVTGKGGGSKTAQPGGGSMAFREKPGFKTGAPGKTQSKDRSGGVKRATVSPSSEGL